MPSNCKLYRGFILSLLLCLCPAFPLYALPDAIKAIMSQLDAMDHGPNGTDPSYGIDSKISSSHASDAIKEGDSIEGIEHGAHSAIRHEENVLLLRVKNDIDRAICDEKLTKHAATWYCRVVAYARLLRSMPLSQDGYGYLQEVLKSFSSLEKIAKSSSKWVVLASGQLINLWNFFLGKGYFCYQEGIFDRAIQYLELCRSIFPSEPEPLMHLGMIYHAMKDYKHALEHYMAYMDVGKPSVNLYMAVAHIQHVNLHCTDQAIMTLKQALLKFPYDNTILNELCTLYRAVDQLEDYGKLLLADTVSSREVLSDHMRALYAYANYLAYGKDMDQAIHCYQLILEHEPKNYHALCQLGLIYQSKCVEDFRALSEVAKERSLYSLWTICNLCRGYPYLLSCSGQDMIIQHKYSLYRYGIMYQFSLVFPHLWQVFACLHCKACIRSSSMMDMDQLQIRMICCSRMLSVIYDCYRRQIQLKKTVSQAASYFLKAYNQNRNDPSLLLDLYYDYLYLKKHRLTKLFYHRLGERYDSDWLHEHNPFVYR